MSELIVENPPKRKRLKFIDMARSIAILLMLEGHFTDLVLGANFRSPDPHFVNPDYLAYDIWHVVRGYTSPIFLTMTGMVFVYLLYLSNGEPYWSNERVKKGFMRVLELLFWGYLLNPSGFHILQCIGYGIFGLLIVYGIYKWVKIIPLWIWYMSIGVILFWCFYPLSQIQELVDGKMVAKPWPFGAPNFIQNMMHGPYNRSLFPLAPNLGYTFFGAGIGVLLHSKWMNAKNWIVPIFLFGFGLFLFFLSGTIIVFFNKMSYQFFGAPLTNFVNSKWLYETMGIVFIILGILSTVEKTIEIKENLFIRVGQNTLSIFVVHMMLLYGAVIQIGISDFFSKRSNPLDPYQSAIGVLLFLSFFIVMIKYVKPLSVWVAKLFRFLLPRKYVTEILFLIITVFVIKTHFKPSGFSTKDIYEHSILILGLTFGWFLYKRPINALINQFWDTVIPLRKRY